MGIFKKKNNEEQVNSVQLKEMAERENGHGYMKYGMDFLTKRMDAYMQDEISLSSCMDDIKKRTETTQEELNNIDKITQKYIELSQSAMTQMEMNISSKWFEKQPNA